MSSFTVENILIIKGSRQDWFNKFLFNKNNMTDNMTNNMTGPYEKYLDKSVIDFIALFWILKYVTIKKLKIINAANFLS